MMIPPWLCISPSVHPPFEEIQVGAMLRTRYDVHPGYSKDNITQINQTGFLIFAEFLVM